MIKQGHPAKDWWAQASEGGRIYNLPSSVAPFMNPRPGSGIRGLSSASQTDRDSFSDPGQVRLLGLLDSQVWAQLTAVQALLQQLARYDQAAFDELAPQLEAYFEVTSALEGRITQMSLPASAEESAAFEGDIIVLSSDIAEYQRRVSKALRGSIESGQRRTAIWGVLLGAGAIGVGWYVFRNARKGRLAFR